jgi:hypothetical protein
VASVASRAIRLGEELVTANLRNHLVSAPAVAALGLPLVARGAVIGAVVGFVVGWIVGLFDDPDDVIGMKTWELDLLTPATSYFAGLGLQNGASEPGNMHFEGDDGRYNVTLHWRVA